MKFKSLKQVYAATAVSILIASWSPLSWAIDAEEIPKFVMSGAWGNFSFPPLQVYGEWGPQVQLEATEISEFPATIYFSKSLLQQFAVPAPNANSSSNALLPESTVNQANGTITPAHIKVNSPLPLTNDELLAVQSAENQAKSLADIRALALGLSQTAIQYKKPCAIYVSLNEVDNTLTFDLQQLTLRQTHIEDGQYFKARAIKHRLGLKPSQPLNLETLERNVRQLKANPDLDVEVTLEPINYSQDVDLNIKVNDNRPWHVVNFFNNYNLNEYGTNFLGTAFIHNNVTGLGDSLLISPIFSRKGQGIITRYEVPINSHGTRLFMDYAYVHAKPDYRSLTPFDMSGHVNVFTPGIMQILYDKNKMRILTDLALNIKQSDGDAFDGSVDIEREQIRDIRYGIQLDRNDKTGNTSMRHEIGWGLDIFGGTSDASSKLSNPGGGTNFFRYTGSLVRSQNLPWNTQGIFQAIVNLTGDATNSFDQWGPGGAFLGRGYRESYIGGDKAFLLTSEWQIPGFFIPKSWKIPHTEDLIRDNVQLVLFTDYSYTKLNNQPAGSDVSEHLLGSGVGVRVSLSKYLTGRLDVAVPLLRQPPFGQGPRFHFGLESALF